jgi:hypothetical protein
MLKLIATAFLAILIWKFFNLLVNILHLANKKVIIFIFRFLFVGFILLVKFIGFYIIVSIYFYINEIQWAQTYKYQDLIQKIIELTMTILINSYKLFRIVNITMISLMINFILVFCLLVILRKYQSELWKNQSKNIVDLNKK